jgi:hypothetical protein
MSVLINFLLLRIITVTDGLVSMLCAAWVVLLLLGLWSIWSSPFGVFGKLAWSIVVCGLPIAGLGVYTLRCFLTAEWEVLRQMGLFSKNRTKLTRSTQFQLPKKR